MVPGRDQREAKAALGEQVINPLGGEDEAQPDHKTGGQSRDERGAAHRIE